jgi:CBS domain containing-hemolysin-like protein
VFGSAWVGLFSGVLTFLILVVSEIIPKTLGASYARGLSGFVGHTLVFLTRVMGPALLLSRTLTRMLTRGKRAPFSRGELEAILDRASRDGALSIDESAMFANLLHFNEVQVEDVMTPRTVTFLLPAEATVDDLLASEEAGSFSRIPLYRTDRDDVVGYILQRDALKEAAQGCDRSRTLESFMRPVWFVPEMISVGAALRQFLDRRETLAMVTDEHGGVAGLVTLEDLTETILGAEIVDEMDRIVDLRQAAADKRDRRLQRLREDRKLVGGPES